MFPASSIVSGSTGKQAQPCRANYAQLLRMALRPGTFAVRQLEIGQPLRVHVGMDGEGEEAAEFSWSLLILETLVQGVVTFWDDSGIRYMPLAFT